MSETLQKRLVKVGNGKNNPKMHDKVTIAYVAWLYDLNETANEYRGKQFDQSSDRGDFEFTIGTDPVIDGLREGVMLMTLGETSVLTIPGHMAYPKGWANLIPAGATLIYKVELKAIGNEKATPDGSKPWESSSEI